MSGRRILMGVFGRPHGVRGLLRVISYAAHPSDLAAYGPLTDDSGRCFEVVWRGQGVAEVAERVGETRVPVASRAAAALLTNTRLYIDRAALPPTEEEEFYIADLVGLPAVDTTGKPLGRIAAVHDYGAGPSLEIASEDSAPLLVPFTRVAVPAVDLAAGRVVIDPPAELAAA